MSRTLNPAQVEKIIALTAQAVAKSKADWLDAQMARIMPAKLYAFRNSNAGNHRAKMLKWIGKNKVSLREHPMIKETHQPYILISNGKPDSISQTSLTELVMGEHVISEFRVRHKDGKIETQSKDFDLPEDEEPKPAA